VEKITAPFAYLFISHQIIFIPMRSSPNIILIGMPGSGKSTAGVLLAKKTTHTFVDTDLLIQNAEKQTLQQIVDSRGYQALRAIEEKILLGLDGRNQVIATGGSAVYSEKAMKHLHELGVIVFLDVDMTTLLSRVSDYETRGLAKRPDQSIVELFEERLALYQKYADVTIACGSMNHEAVCAKILELMVNVL
jgi:shikimate kinase